MIYYENVVKILWTWHFLFFLLFHRFRNLFFPSFLAMSLPQFANFFFYSPISVMALLQLGAHKFFFSPKFGNVIATISVTNFFELIITNHVWFYCENVVKILWTWQLFFFYSFIDFITFFFPIFDNAIATIRLSIFLFLFFPFHFGHSTHGQQNWAKEIWYYRCRNSTFSLSTFFFFSLILLVEFRHRNTKIQSPSSKSQITLNSTYNAN